MISSKNEAIIYAISEAAKLSGLPESTLRYYEKIGIINPISRDDSSKHRVYDENDLNIITAIACLNATGMPLKEMKQYLDNLKLDSDVALRQLDLLNTQKQRLEKESHYLQLKKQYVNLKLDYWHAVNDGNTDDIESIGKKAKIIAAKLKTEAK